MSRPLLWEGLVTHTGDMCVDRDPRDFNTFTFQRHDRTKMPTAARRVDEAVGGEVTRVYDHPECGDAGWTQS
jgi:hypothetical protein